MKRMRWGAWAGLLMMLASCAERQPSKPMATDIDPKQATPQYWLDQPAVVRIGDEKFDRLWSACRAEAHDRFFLIDREDFRLGLLTTQPLISKQGAELWRRDAVTVNDIAAATLATIRRTIFFQLNRQSDGSYVAEPKVLVEREASAERRLTAITEYHEAFTGTRPFGTAETDEGQQLPTDYWYAIGRDYALERDLAGAIRGRLGL